MDLTSSSLSSDSASSVEEEAAAIPDALVTFENGRGPPILLMVTDVGFKPGRVLTLEGNPNGPKPIVDTPVLEVVARGLANGRSSDAGVKFGLL